MKGRCPVTNRGGATSVSGVLRGVGLAFGNGYGVLVHADEIVSLFGSVASDGQGQTALSEHDRYSAALQALDASLRREMSRLTGGECSAAGSILEAHHCILHDPELAARVRAAIEQEGLRAQDGVRSVFEQAAAELAESANELLSQRAADIREVGRRLAAAIDPPAPRTKGAGDATGYLAVAEELRVSWVLNARQCGVAGFVVREGTSLSHAAILARALQLPVIQLDGREYEALNMGTSAMLEAGPGSARLLTNRTRQTPHSDTKTHQAPRKRNALSGTRLWLNVVQPGHAPRTFDAAVAGAGLFRTEYFFMGHSHDFPAEQEQYEYYARVFREFGAKTVTIRTLDIGGDKELSYFSLGPQDNPYLGLRGHRLYRYHPDVFITQVRAILRAGSGSKRVRILYPMIESVDELLYVKELYSKAASSLRADGIPFAESAEQGLMIEVPSTAWAARRFLRHVDFGCVGTNDLFQYFFAVDRNNANVLDYYAPEAPAALAMLESVVDAARAEGKPLSLCGEIASDRYYAPLLIGLGFRDLSVDIHAVDDIAEALGELSLRACQRLVRRCLSAETTTAAERLLRDFWKRRGKAFERPRRPKQGEHVDPVCGMYLSTVDHQLSTISNGTRHYFCTPRCLRTFTRRRRRGMAMPQQNRGHATQPHVASREET